jgi:type IV pilus assembly protein PilV
MSSSHTPRFRRAHGGMTLIEVLVTLVLISVGLLGVAALQLTSLKNNQESYVRSQAAVLAADILDRMRSNQTGFNAGNYDMPTDATGFDQAGAAGTAAAADIAAWQAAINRLLPGADSDAAGRIVRDGRLVTISIRWREREERATERTYDPADLPMFRTRSEI